MSSLRDASLDERAARATVAIITALPKEQVAMKAMLDNVVEYSTPGRAPGEYHLGTIPAKSGGVHTVVLARCSIGENLSTANATILLERFPAVQLAIMVGIAGGVPAPGSGEHDIRLGDIVVSGLQGVIQYDFEKESLRDGEVTRDARHPPRPPSARLIQASDDLLAGELEQLRPWELHFARAGKLAGATRPHADDVLHDASDPAVIISRAPRARPGLPLVFRGPIASGNKLLKNVKLRERLRATFGVKAVEMEAAGVADAAWLQHAGYFVVRGICDYCDSFKDDQWQEYAAMVAAAYARSLLEATRALPAPGLPLLVEPGEEHALPPSVSTVLGEAQAPTVSRLLLDLIGSDSTSLAEYDLAWPADRPWSMLVIDAARAALDEARPYVELNAGERLLLAASPFVVASLARARCKDQFSDAAIDDTIRALAEESPAAGSLLDLDIDEAAKDFVRRWAVLRLLQKQRPSWSDDEFRTSSPDVPLARWLLANSYVRSMIRTAAGNIESFEVLPERGLLTIGPLNFDIRWKLVACILSLAELRVLGIHLLSNEVIKSAAQIPEVLMGVEQQFKDLLLIPELGTTWVIRATCTEPVLDHAICEIADSLNTELRRNRARMSDYAAQHTRRAYPSVRADPQPALIDNRPRYTTPHVLFSLSSDHARRLFMGTDLWGDPQLAYRELFQNALDACRYRKARSDYLEVPYEPRIRIHQGRMPDGREYVECEDNGIGMHRGIVASCFSTAGKRFADTDEFQRERSAWSARGLAINVNSQFGIGIFSYFLVADRIEIETARLGLRGEAPATRLLIQIPAASSFFRIVTISDEESRTLKRQRATERQEAYSGQLDAGTRVRLYLRAQTDASSHVGNNPSCVASIRHNVKISEVNTLVTDYRGQIFELIADQLSWESTKRGGNAEPRFWWRTDVGPWVPQDEQVDVVTTHRSRTQRSSKVVYERPGRVLVDGILTELSTPGFIIDFRGADTPKLSLDRKKVRTDLRDSIETRVRLALDEIPDPVPEALLNDLWAYDPRVCHEITKRLQTTGRPWLRNPPFRLRRPDERRIETTGCFFPPISRDLDSTVTPNPKKILIELWKASQRVSSINEDPIVLEEKGLSSDLAKRLKKIPQVLWHALRELVLGVPEAVALDTGLDRRSVAALPARMSWLSGETIGYCSERLAKFTEFLDAPSPPAIGGRRDVVVGDFQAWLLGHGSFNSAWVWPAASTVDVLIFAFNARRKLDEAVAEWEQVTEELGLELKLENSLASQLWPLMDAEVAFAESLRAGYGGEVFRQRVDDDRAQLIAQAAMVSCPPRDVDAREVRKLSELEQRALRELRLDGTRRVTIADLCELAHRLEKPVSEVAALIATLSEATNLHRAWSDDEVEHAGALTPSDWILLTDDSFNHRRDIRPRVAMRLAARIALNVHRLRKSPGELLARVDYLYKLLGWGDSPITLAQIESAYRMTYPQIWLLEKIPRSGTLSIARMVFLLLTSDSDLATLLKDIRTLTSFGVVIPSPDDCYLGVRWAEMVSAFHDGPLQPS